MPTLKLDADGNVTSIGPYKIIKKLGQGAFGTAYLAQNVNTKKEYVVKKLDRDDAEYEYKRLIALGDQCIYHLACPTALYLDGNDGYLVSVFVRGVNLDNYVGKADNIMVTDLAKQLLPALDKIHSMGIYHRDIKPGNLIYDEKRNFYTLIDFGLACINSCPKGRFFCGGTPPFMSLGYLQSCKDGVIADKVTLENNDLFALGVTMFYLSEGVFPYASRKDSKGRFYYIWDESTDYRNTDELNREIINDLLSGELSAEEIYKKYFYLNSRGDVAVRASTFAKGADDEPSC